MDKIYQIHLFDHFYKANNHFYKQQTKSLMLNNLSTKEQEAHFLNLTKTHPDKIRLYNPKQGKILEKQKSEASR